jgi:hypothetical protein
MGSSQKTAVCGAKNRRGHPCQRPPQPGKKRCWYHGGADRSGAQAGNKNGVKHGFYSRRCLPSEIQALTQLTGAPDLANELRITRLMLGRVLLAWTKAIRSGDGLSLVEIESGGGLETPRRIRRAIDYASHFARLARTAAYLSQVMTQAGTGDNDPESIAAQVRAHLNATAEPFLPPEDPDRALLVAAKPPNGRDDA